MNINEHPMVQATTKLSLPSLFTILVLLSPSQNCLPTLPLSTIAYLMIPSVTLSPASSTCLIISVRIPYFRKLVPIPHTAIPGYWNGLVSLFFTNCQHYRQRFSALLSMLRATASGR